MGIESLCPSSSWQSKQLAPQHCGDQGTHRPSAAAACPSSSAASAPGAGISPGGINTVPSEKSGYLRPHSPLPGSQIEQARIEARITIAPFKRIFLYSCRIVTVIEYVELVKKGSQRCKILFCLKADPPRAINSSRNESTSSGELPRRVEKRIVVGAVVLDAHHVRKPCVHKY